MSAASHDEPEFATAVGIVGVGLIGGSIAAALKQRRFAGRVIGLGRDIARLERARTSGLIDAIAPAPRALAEQADLIVVCTPVNRIAADVRALAAHARPGTLLTDAGSSKREICRDLSSGLPEGVTFIGSHPLAGSEKQGFEHAVGGLFHHRVCVVTPGETTPRPEFERLRRFWEYLGSTTVEMSADEHDQALAQTSHVPHLAAAAVALTLADANRRFAAGGFRDTTRIAAGDPELWAAILLSNIDDVAAGVRVLEEKLAEFRGTLERHDAAALKKLLQVAKTNRDVLDQK